MKLSCIGLVNKGEYLSSDVYIWKKFFAWAIIFVKKFVLRSCRKVLVLAIDHYLGGWQMARSSHPEKFVVFLNPFLSSDITVDV